MQCADELVHTEERDGFTIKLYFAPEEMAIRDSFDEDEAGYADLENKVERGVYLWFCATVTASREDLELGADYLGGCMYEDVAAFIAPGGYYDDMVAEAVDQARVKLLTLCAKLEA